LVWTGSFFNNTNIFEMRGDHATGALHGKACRHRWQIAMSRVGGAIGAFRRIVFHPVDVDGMRQSMAWPTGIAATAVRMFAARG
jgi:hypothetical protein